MCQHTINIHPLQCRRQRLRLTLFSPDIHRYEMYVGFMIEGCYDALQCREGVCRLFQTFHVIHWIRVCNGGNDGVAARVFCIITKLFIYEIHCVCIKMLFELLYSMSKIHTLGRVPYVFRICMHVQIKDMYIYISNTTLKIFKKIINNYYYY